MRKFVVSVLTAASVSFGLAGAVEAQIILKPQEVKGPEFDNIGRDPSASSKSSGAFYVSCSFMASLPGEQGKVWTLPLMFVVNTDENRRMPPDSGPVRRSYTETFDAIQDPREIFDKNKEVTVIDHRPVYMLIEWSDTQGRDATILLPYAGVVAGPHRVTGILGHGHLEPSFDPKDWKVIPGGTLDHAMQAKCNVYETTRGSVVMGAIK